MKTYLKSFLSGFLSTFIFHQGLVGLFFLLGLSPRAPYNFSPVPPFGVPSVVSLAFFGGLWGILIWKLVSKEKGFKLWLKSAIYGAVGPTAVAFGVVFPLKGISMPPTFIIFGLILNGAWGIGNSLLFRRL